MLGDADRDMLKHLTSVSREARGQQKDEVTDDEAEVESGMKTEPTNKVEAVCSNPGCQLHVCPQQL